MRKLCSKLRHWSYSAVVWIASEHLQKQCCGSFRSKCLVLPAFDQRIDIIVKFLIGDALQFLVSPVYHRFGWWIRLWCPMYDALGAWLLLRGAGFLCCFWHYDGKVVSVSMLLVNNWLTYAVGHFGIVVIFWDKAVHDIIECIISYRIEECKIGRLYEILMSALKVTMYRMR